MQSKQREHIRRIGGTLGIASMLVVGGILAAPGAWADTLTDNQVTANDVAQALSAASSDGDTVAPVLPAHSDSDSASFAQVGAGATVDVPKDPSDGVELSSSTGQALTVSIPGAEKSADSSTLADGTVVYSTDSGTANAVRPTSGGVQMLTVIANSAAPSSYDYALSLSAGQSIVVEDTGAAHIANADGTISAFVGVPWATDASGASLPTHYQVSGNVLTQVIDLTGASYPVTADPWFGQQLISRVAWSENTLQVYPTNFGRYWWSAGYLARWAAWAEVVKLAPSANRQNMQDQFYCHWDLVRYRAPNKVSWNLDRNRPNVGYWATVAAQCNP